jgi:hypothetical protein
VKGRCLTLLLLALTAYADEEAGFELVPGAAATLKVRQSAALSLSIVPHTGYRLLASGPVTVRVRAEGCKPEWSLYQREQAVDPRAEVPRFEIKVTGERAGTATLEAQCTFYLCRGELCRPVQTSHHWNFEVSR